LLEALAIVSCSRSRPVTRGDTRDQLSDLANTSSFASYCCTLNVHRATVTIRSVRILPI
jgi:hypothetical protein